MTLNLQDIKLRLVIAWLTCLLTYLSNAQDSFEFVVLPDTQTYIEEHPDVFTSQMQWLKENSDRFSFVLHVGDITQNNSEKEWQIAREGFSLLDGLIPYNLALGNHDMGSGPGKFADTRDTSLANHYFRVEDYIKQSKAISVFPESTIDNTCSEYHLIGEKWLVFSLEFGPQTKTLDWANKLIEKHPEHKIILNTHAYLYEDSTLHDGDDWYLPQKYGVGKAAENEAVNDGGDIWKKLLKNKKNSMFVFSGHILGSGVGTLAATNDYGHLVYQMLANFQKNIEGFEKGDSGYLRIIKVNKKLKTITVKTYSPWLNEFIQDPRHDFVFSNVEF